nr:MGMT family protein [Corynebacterium macginleyi]
MSIVILCHRVVGAGGSLTRYTGDLDRKRFPLGLEEPAETKGRDCSRKSDLRFYPTELVCQPDVLDNA